MADRRCGRGGSGGPVLRPTPLAPARGGSGSDPTGDLARAWARKSLLLGRVRGERFREFEGGGARIAEGIRRCYGSALNRSVPMDRVWFPKKAPALAIAVAASLLIACTDDGGKLA